MTRPIAQYETALYLVELGLNDCQIARTLEVPQPTIHRWRTRGRSHHPVQHQDCFPDRGLDPERYAYLLGLYLGDGHIVQLPKNTQRLDIGLDSAYPEIVRSAVDAMGGVKKGRVATRQVGNCSIVYSHWAHWSCAFPQHGPGRKHDRSIELMPWQEVLVADYPQALLRGLIHSDGCRVLNRVSKNGRAYVYPRYQFSNRSGDILDIFCRACEAAGVAWKRMNSSTIAISRRGDVERLDRFIGPKA